ncbi:hypothetical protein FRC20_009444 [Serendipita sp. 405]|nr:hypothetical protein FRC18_009520 [Serendipita sp. 400]KAG8865827.1 hypothetical protein FRC20_009444 [Serendipita sp. 405]
MSAVLTTLQKTQIVVSADSDEEEAIASRLFTHAQPSSPHSNGFATGAGITTRSGDYAALSTLSLKYPHTRSCLLGIIKENRVDGEADGDETDSLLQQVLANLKEENEEELKNTLRLTLELSQEAAEQAILELMHAHHGDLTQAPLNVLQPAKRPISRPSSRASSHSFRLNRPESPLASYGISTLGSAPSSPKAIQIAFRRPHTPVTSPLVSNLHTNANSYIINQANPSSPTSSPPLPHATVVSLAAASPSSSPLSSPRFLNAREFKPGRPLSIGSNPGTPSGDVWSSNVPPSSLTRTSSNLAIAPPLVLTPRSSTPVNNPMNIPSRPGSSLAVPSKPPFDDEEEDEFSPFSKPRTILYKGISNTVHASNSEGTGGTSENSASSPSNSYDRPMSFDDDFYGPGSNLEFNQPYLYGGDDKDDDSSNFTRGSYALRDRHSKYSSDRPRDGEGYDPNVLEGMTPLDVLMSVFGTTMSHAEVENVLAQHGWNFDEAMQSLIERASGDGAAPVGSTEHSSDRFGSGGRPGIEGRNTTFIGRQAHGRGSFPYGPGPPLRQMSRPGRVCRYFLANECLRADCRFSHDLDRALCRFWLRGVCAKGDNCEFMHRLPPNMEGGGPPPLPPPPFVVDPNASARGGRFDDRSPARQDSLRDQGGTPAEEEFPALGTTPEDRERGRFGDRGSIHRQGSLPNDPSRSRFAAAVKKQNSTGGPVPLVITGSKFVVNPKLVEEPVEIPIISPKPSARIKLRPPTLLPVLPTGDTLNKLYMTYRERPLQLQAARNACLARAADAWRRNDAANAKRFSHEANELNGKMAGEAREAANRLLRERSRVLTQEVQSSRSGGNGAGRPAGGGLGVLLGVAFTDAGSAKTDTEEMRTEIAMDLHGLHAAEGIDYLEEFILALEKERFLGLTYVVVGEERHTGTQDSARGASKLRLAAAVKDWLHSWGYPWNEWNGVICIDCLSHY